VARSFLSPYFPAIITDMTVPSFNVAAVHDVSLSGGSRECFRRSSRRSASAAREARMPSCFPKCSVRIRRGFSADSSRESTRRFAFIATSGPSSHMPMFLSAVPHSLAAGGSTLCWSLIVSRREVFRYSKIHLTPGDAKSFFAGTQRWRFFHLDGIPCTASSATNAYSGAGAAVRS